MERYITIKFPLKVSTISTPFKAKITIFFIIIISIGLGSYAIPTLGLVAYAGWECDVLDRYLDLYHVLTVIIIESINHIASISLVLIFTILIIYELSKMKKFRYAQSDAKWRGKKNQEDQLIHILLAVAISFLLLRIPYLCAYEITQNVDKLWSPVTAGIKYDLFRGRMVGYILSVINHCTNFFLYCCCGSSFR